MKYQVFATPIKTIPQGWSMNIRGTERHYRVGDCIVSYNRLVKTTRYRLGDLKKMKSSVCFKDDDGKLNEQWGLTLERFRELFISERMKANSKLGQLL